VAIVAVVAVVAVVTVLAVDVTADVFVVGTKDRWLGTQLLAFGFGVPVGCIG